MCAVEVEIRLINVVDDRIKSGIFSNHIVQLRVPSDYAVKDFEIFLITSNSFQQTLSKPLQFLTVLLTTEHSDLEIVESDRSSEPVPSLSIFTSCFYKNCLRNEPTLARTKVNIKVRYWSVSEVGSGRLPFLHFTSLSSILILY